MPPLEGARVLVTGAMGFLGKEVCRALGEAKAKVYPVTRQTYDIRNEAELLTAVCLARPSVIVHLAASHAGAPDFWLLRNTLTMGMNVVHAAALQQARLVWVAPVACLPPDPVKPPGSAMMPVPEIDRLLAGGLDPSRPHAAAVRSVAALIQSYRKKYEDWQAVGLLLPDLYGDGDSAGPVSRALVDAVNAPSWPEPDKAPRESISFTLLHVWDAACAVLEACRKEPAPSGILRLPGTRIRASELDRFIAERFNGAIECAEEDGKKGPQELRVVPLGWKPVFSLARGLRQYWDSLRRDPDPAAPLMPSTCDPWDGDVGT